MRSIKTSKISFDKFENEVNAEQRLMDASTKCKQFSLLTNHSADIAKFLEI